MNLYKEIIRLGYSKYALKLRQILMLNLVLPPRWILIEATSKCNLQCRMCDRKNLPRGEGDLPFEKYKEIIDQLIKLNKDVAINPQGLGEPLINENIYAMISYAREKGVKDIGINTNGTLLTETNVKKLFQSGVTSISVSIDSIVRDTYKKIRIGADHDEVIRNVLNMIEYRNSLRRKIPWIQVSAVDQGVNCDEMDKFVEFWIDQVDAVYSQREYHNFKLVNQSTIDKTRKRIACTYLWRSMTIYWNGDVSVCPMDDKGDLKIGNVYEEPLEAIWYGKRFNEIRKAHLKNALEDYPQCKTCDYWRSTAAENMPVQEIRKFRGLNVKCMGDELYRRFERVK